MRNLRLVGNWAIVLALQKRLDAGRVRQYEALLGLHTLRHLFPGIDSSIPVDVGVLWAYQVYKRLESLVDGEEAPPPDESWLALLLTAQPVSELLIAEDVADLLLEAETL